MRLAEREREIQDEVVALVESAIRTERLLGSALGEQDLSRLGSQRARTLACLVGRLIVATERGEGHKPSNERG